MSRILLIFTLLFASVATGFFYVKPALEEFRLLRQESNDLANISEELDELIENRDTLVSALNTVSRDDLVRVNQALPEGKHGANFLVLLESIAAKNSIELRRVNLAESSSANAEVPQDRTGQPRPGTSASRTPLEGSAIQEFPFSIEIGATYETMKTFLADLENSLRIIDVYSISFTPPSTTGKLGANIQGKTYYQQ